MDEKISFLLTEKEAGIVYEALLAVNWPGKLLVEGAALLKTFAPFAPQPGAGKTPAEVH